jgi:hypothetical protein
MPAGMYTVTYSAVSGYVKPPDSSLRLHPGGTITFGDTYQRLVVALFTGFQPPLLPQGVLAGCGKTLSFGEIRNPHYAE